jgi:sarcosine oxidase subunit beta
MRVAVVGAGITGLAVAFFLAEEGIEVTVLERTGIAAGASGVQPGGVRQQWSTRVNSLLARESVAFYRELSERLGRPVDARLDPCGYLFLAHSDEALAGLRANVALQNDAGVPSRIVSADEAARLVPGLRPDTLAGAAWCAEDGYFDRPQAVVEAFAAAATDRGARIEIAEVRRLSRDGAGWRLDTDGRTVAADCVVVAAGCDTPALLAPLGFPVPIAPEERHLFLGEPVSERLLEPLVISAERRFAAKQLANGRVLASDLAASGDSESRREEWRQNVRAGIEELLPLLEYVSFPLLVSGLYDSTPDHQPAIGPVDDGLWVAAGFSGHGFMLAPAIARRLAAAVSGSRLDDLLDGFRPDRFQDGVLEVERQLV